jgi:hypothetical protein
MNIISSEIVEQTWQEMNTLSAAKISSLINKLTKEQPIVLAYLLAVGDDIFNQDERELLLYLGVVVWKMMSQGDRPLPKVTEEQLDEIEEKNIKMLEYLEGEPDTDFIETVAMIVNDYKQQEVLKYVVEALMEETEEDALITDENKGIMMIYLKTVIDCFDRESASD